MGIGNYLSTIKSPLIKIKRILELVQSLEIDFEAIEKSDLLEQEGFDRLLTASNLKLLKAVETLDREVALNNFTTKEKHLLEKRIQHLEDTLRYKNDRVEELGKLVDKLQKYKNQERAKFKNWLKNHLRRRLK